MENIKEITYPGYVITKQKISFCFVASLMIIVPITEIIGELLERPCLNMMYNISMYGIIGTVISAVFLLMDINDKKFYPVDIFYLLLIFFALISLIFAVDGERPLFETNYHEYFTHFLCYFSLMLCCTHITDNEYREKILKVFYFVAVIQCIIAFFQTLGLQIFVCYYDTEDHTNARTAYGLTQHCNFFSALCTIFLGLGTGAFLFFSDTKSKKIITALLFALFFYCSLSTGTRLSWVGDISIILFYIVSFIVMKKLKYDKNKLRKIVKRFLVLLIIALLVTIPTYTSTIYIKNGIEDVIRESTADDISTLGTGRFYIWEMGLKTVPEHWLTGLGLDHYGYSFFLNPDWESGMPRQDKGHNEYIHILVCEGVFALINYLSLLVYACVSGVKNVIHSSDDKTCFISWTLVSMAAGYICQAFFNSSVINIAIYFWIVLGLIMPITNQKAFTFKKSLKSKKA